MPTQAKSRNIQGESSNLASVSRCVISKRNAWGRASPRKVPSSSARLKADKERRIMSWIAESQQSPIGEDSGVDTQCYLDDSHFFKDEPVGNGLKRTSDELSAHCSPPKCNKGNEGLHNDYLDLLEPSPGYMRQMAMEALAWYEKRLNIPKNERQRHSSARVDILDALWKRAMHGVIKRIFSHIPLKELANFALVCQRWNEIFRAATCEERERRFPEIQERRRKMRANRENQNVQVRQLKGKADFKHALKERNGEVESGEQERAESVDGELLCIDKFDKSPARIEGRNYTHKPCPRCRRSSLVDLSYHKGQCLYVNCRLTFCSVCNRKYHPFLSCLEPEVLERVEAAD